MGQWFSRKKQSVGHLFLPKQIKTLQTQLESYKKNINEYRSETNRNIRNLYEEKLEDAQYALNKAKKSSRVYRTLKTLRIVSGGKRKTRRLSPQKNRRQ